MTVSTSITSVTYNGTGSQTVFPTTFAFFAAADIEVTERIVATGVETTKVLTTDYSVSGGSGATGDVTAVTAPPSTVTWTIRRIVAETQETALPVAGSLPSSAIEQMVDRTVMMIQQHSEEIARSLLAPVTSGLSGLTIPDPVANNLVGWNAGATNLENKLITDASTTVITAFATSLLNDADAAEARDTLELGSAAALTAGTAANNAVQLDGSARLPAVDGSLLTGLGVASDIRLAFLLIAENRGDRVNMTDGVADPFADETDVDTAISSGEVYDATGGFYFSIGPESSAASVVLNADPNSDSGEHQRVVIDATEISGSGVQIRVRFEASSLSQYVIDDAYIGHAAAAGNAWDFDGNQVRLTFDGGNNGKTIATGTTSFTDWVDFSIDDTKSLIVSTDVGDATSRPKILITQGGWETYTTASTNAAGSTTHSPMGADNDVQGVNLIEIRARDNLTLVSNAFTADSTPATGRIHIQVQENEAITINTDLIAEISRDNGMTWSLANLTLVETLSDGTKAYEDASVDISGQPSGTAMKYRTKTLNNKDIELHGVVLQWS